MKYSFAPLIDDNSITLILGSLPGERSLETGRYYAHPQNYFWKILYEVYREPMPGSFDMRYEFILRHNLALWDSVKCARRVGSLDGNIRDEEPNDIPALTAMHPKLSLIVFNGAAAFAKYKKHFGEPNLPYRRLLSTSPACAGRNAERFRMWREALLRE
ncbi:MAG: DNA-deoxyinosine glycosylase [Synergistes sp.]|nr:DNA-deoxyinosine glycosylase [Synergistes sp.]